MPRMDFMPFWQGCAAQQRADQGGCLFERSEIAPDPDRCEQRKEPEGP